MQFHLTYGVDEQCFMDKKNRLDKKKSYNNRKDIYYFLVAICLVLYYLPIINHMFVFKVNGITTQKSFMEE